VRVKGVARVCGSVVQAGLIAGLLAVAALGAGCSKASNSTTPVPATVAAAPATVAAAPASITAVSGEVRLTPGPFSDRVQVTGMRLEGASVHGRLAITTDVSDVLALEVRAAFYDATGKLIGTGLFEHSDEEPVSGGPHIPSNDGIDFVIASTTADVPVSAAVLTIPVLVNE
jgi:hypothetical protein